MFLLVFKLGGSQPSPWPFSILMFSGFHLTHFSAKLSAGDLRAAREKPSCLPPHHGLHDVSGRWRLGVDRGGGRGGRLPGTGRGGDRSKIRSLARKERLGKGRALAS